MNLIVRLQILVLLFLSAVGALASEAGTDFSLFTDGVCEGLLKKATEYRLIEAYARSLDVYRTSLKGEEYFLSRASEVLKSGDYFTWKAEESALVDTAKYMKDLGTTVKTSKTPKGILFDGAGTNDRIRRLLERVVGEGEKAASKIEKIARETETIRLPVRERTIKSAADGDIYAGKWTAGSLLGIDDKRIVYQGRKNKDAFKNSVFVIDIATGKKRQISSISEGGHYTGILFSKDLKTAVAYASNDISLIDLDAGKIVKRFHPSMSISHISVDSDFKKIIAFGESAEGDYEIFSLPTGDRLVHGKGPTGSYKCSEARFDQKRVVAGYGYGGVVLWDLETGKRIAKTEVGSSPSNVWMNREMDHVLVLNLSGNFGLYDVSKMNRGEESAFNSFGKGEVFDFDRRLMNEVAVNEDFSRVLAGEFSGDISYWDLSARKQIMSLKGHSESVKHIRFDEKAGRAVTASGKEVILWDLATGSGLYKMVSLDDEVVDLVTGPGLDKFWILFDSGKIQEAIVDLSYLKTGF